MAAQLGGMVAGYWRGWRLSQPLLEDAGATGPSGGSEGTGPAVD